VFKNSYFIGLVRDGRAVTEGIFRKSGVSMERGVAHWIKANTVMLEDSKFLKKFKLVRYEDMVTDPAKEAKSLFEFIGVDPKEGKLDFQSILPIVNMDGSDSAIKNFNQKSFDRIPSEKFRELSVKIEPTMKMLGYQV
jgi:hypothetical protein